MVKELEDGALPGFGGETNRTRCFDHIVNIVGRTVVRQFDVPKGKLGDAEAELSALAQGIEEEEEATQDEIDDELDDDDEIDGWVAGEDTEMSDDEREELEESVRPVRLLLVKVTLCHMPDSDSEHQNSTLSRQLRRLAYAILHSTTILLPAWFTLLESLKVSARKMPRDVTTRWNSTYDMLVFALEYRAAIDQICGTKANGLRKYEISAGEWRIAGQLRDVLKVSPFFHARDSFFTLEIRPFSLVAQVFKDATLFFSRATPNLTMVIPAMDHIDERLATDGLNKDLDPSIRASVSLAKKTLNRYYEKTDRSVLYQMAMSE
jgi:hypothetical protein